MHQHEEPSGRGQRFRGRALTDLEFQIKEIYEHRHDPKGYPAVLIEPKD